MFQPNFYSMFLYDSMLLYAWAATQVLDDGGSLSDGTALFDKTKSSVTRGQDNSVALYLVCTSHMQCNVLFGNFCNLYIYKLDYSNV